MMRSNYAIVGDIGGTNFRLGLSTPSGIQNIREYNYTADDSPRSLITAYMETCNTPKFITRAVFAVATPSKDPRHIIFTNGPWKQRPVDFTLDMPVAMLNDFAALTYSINQITDKDCSRLDDSAAKPFLPALRVTTPANNVNVSKILFSSPAKRFSIVGPGTGLGASSGFVTESGQFLVIDGEGGHTNFAPSNETELAIMQHLQYHDGLIISKETVASGTGLPKVFNAYCEIKNISARVNNGAEVTVYAQNEKNEKGRAAQWTLDLFAKTLGDCAATLILNNNAQTLFLAGGIVPKLGDLFNKAAFMGALHKNDLGQNNFALNVPVMLIRHEHPGLLGAHAYARLTQV